MKKKKLFKALEARKIVDLAINEKLFKDGLTRDKINDFEDFIYLVLVKKFKIRRQKNSLPDFPLRGKKSKCSLDFSFGTLKGNELFDV